MNTILDSVGTTLSYSLYCCWRLESHKSKPSVLIPLDLVTGHVNIQHISKLRHVFLQDVLSCIKNCATQYFFKWLGSLLIVTNQVSGCRKQSCMSMYQKNC